MSCSIVHLWPCGISLSTASTSVDLTGSSFFRGLLTGPHYQTDGFLVVHRWRQYDSRRRGTAVS